MSTFLLALIIPCNFPEIEPQLLPASATSIKPFMSQQASSSSSQSSEICASSFSRVFPRESRELPTLFDRFVRGEQSRDRSGGKAGYGLGLSIARAIAEKNDIKLEVGEDDAGRIVFRALFPAR